MPAKTVIAIKGMLVQALNFGLMVFLNAQFLIVIGILVGIVGERVGIVGESVGIVGV